MRAQKKRIPTLKTGRGFFLPWSVMPSTAAVVATAAAVTASAAVVTASAAVVTAAEYDYEEYDYPAASVAKSVVTHVVSSFPFSTTSYVASRICVTPTDSELRNLYKVMPYCSEEQTDGTRTTIRPTPALLIYCGRIKLAYFPTVSLNRRYSAYSAGILYVCAARLRQATGTMGSYRGVVNEI